ncbi:DUF1643 domain-containing protein [Enterococcus caccae]|uniref:Uncharacterized protein n=1 Tax=Enterococcus caccae ATCC BAA-1240 TaxID=1158612 RepID=R3TSK8_9ENTE|nr:DUF1643 domain-containing protein [Enterococcus caccae]EOL44534.1 hypothetical protein UC7_02077 [Enterococcus caccae ATCC BAA-1240]EOT58677.1 hypothetical protein I580_02849 [Enterococcus caccae ATCC BAA-1240]OJG25977.1 hypothetical protein RU98_GL000854 [Enterococcus caccae]
MIQKRKITIQSESWSNTEGNHRYLLKKVRGDAPLFLGMSTMLIQGQIRKQEFSGILAVNLFSSTKIKGTAQSLTGGSDDQTFTVSETCLAEKQLTEIIIGVDSILRTNELAKKQLETFYALLSTKQKKQVKVFVDEEEHPTHPLAPKVWYEWCYISYAQYWKKNPMTKGV